MFEFNQLFIILFVVLFLIIYSLRKRRFNAFLAKIPGPETYPLIGNLNIIWSNSCDPALNRLDQILIAMSVLYANHGIFKFKMGQIQQVVIFRNDLAQVFLKDNKNLLKGFGYNFIEEWFGKGLICNDNIQLWKERRKLLSPAFHSNILKNFIPIINEKANVLLEKLGENIGQNSFNLEPLLYSCALDAITETTLGVKLNSQQNRNLEYFEAIHRMEGNIFKRMVRPWLYLDFIYYLTKSGKQYKSDAKTLHDLSQKVINERKDNLLKDRQNTDLEINDKKKKRLALLDLLLDFHFNDKTFTLKNLREEVDNFIAAGHDTTAVCLSWTFYLLGKHPDIQQRVQEELDSIVGNNEEITMDDIKQFTYLDAVIKESMRIYPPVPLISRTITDEIEFGEYHIPKGVTLVLHIPRLHQDPNVFPEPLLFKPERFLSENQSNSENHFCYTPFSGGPRNCIGQKFAINELKVIIAKVLLNYSLESLEDRNDIIVLNVISSRPLNSIRMKIKPRAK